MGEMDIMQHEIRLASLNVRNLALPGLTFYDNAPPYSQAAYNAKIAWIASQLDESGADIIGLQEIFSPEAIPHILEKTRHYQNAHCITVESGETLPETPNVALISRLPPTAPPVFYTSLPGNLQVALPGDETGLTHFTRPVLHAIIRLPDSHPVHILVVHLKSKRPDYPENASPAAPLMPELGALRALIRRGTDALGIRHLVARLRENSKTPVIVMGDFNEFPLAAPMQIIAGNVPAPSVSPAGLLCNCYDIQPGLPHREKHSPFFPDTGVPRIDHILVSEEFTEKTRFRLGKITSVRHFGSHPGNEKPETSDHGLLMATLQLRQLPPRLADDARHEAASDVRGPHAYKSG